jgi:hypothetical protein
VNNAIFEAKLKDIKFNTTPTIIGCIMGGILLNHHYVYAKDAAQQGAEVINSLCSIGPPALLSAAEIYKVRSYIKIYMENLKLNMRKNDK